MSLHTLVGKLGEDGAAVMVDSDTGWAIGPAFVGDDAAEQVDAFKEWMRGRCWIAHRDEIFGAEMVRTQGLMPYKVSLLGGEDPRGWTSEGLERIVGYWRSVYVEDCLLLDPDVCECGHSRDAHDDPEPGEAPGCYACLPGPARCTEWKPGNRAAAAASADRERGFR